ncbi:hypothetical protein M408DRAFT_334277 [Serendipita vermifera MAFF 305830]|uniref:Reverse transcriptase domain-containing protein n=1 Tax=Serendipita vermifera MAFF 305830 TaxID=933852 RepID=A0A0C3AKE1_SERVB|nr:hypothetical protein M408DRAFT_334277 [Serendipita vermifera MAFF 305830]
MSAHRTCSSGEIPPPTSSPSSRQETSCGFKPSQNSSVSSTTSAVRTSKPPWHRSSRPSTTSTKPGLLARLAAPREVSSGGKRKGDSHGSAPSLTKTTTRKASQATVAAATTRRAATGHGPEKLASRIPILQRPSSFVESTKTSSKRPRPQSSRPLADRISRNTSGMPFSNTDTSSLTNSMASNTPLSTRKTGVPPPSAITPSVSNPSRPPNQSLHRRIGSIAMWPTKKPSCGPTPTDIRNFGSTTTPSISYSEATRPAPTFVSSTSTGQSGARSLQALYSNSRTPASSPAFANNTSALTAPATRQAAARTFGERVAAAAVVAAGLGNHEGKSKSPAANGMPTVARGPRGPASSSTSASTVAEDTLRPSARKRPRGPEDESKVTSKRQKTLRPRYLRNLLWADECVLSSPSAAHTEIALPFAAPSSTELSNGLVVGTIRSRPDLFKIVTPVNVARLGELLIGHPNRPFVDSLLRSLKAGFWPWADTTREPAEVTRNNNRERNWSEEEVVFIQETCREEEEAGRFSSAFGSELLPGMVCGPVFPVPKPGTNKLRLVTDHSAGTFSLNSLIPEDSRSVRFDNLHDLGSALRHFHRTNNRGPRWLFKSDVSKAYRLIPMHPHWQIRQVFETPEGGKMMMRVDRCGVFGNAAMVRVFCAFFGAIIWVAINVCAIDGLFHYIDDANGYDDNPHLVFYEPYNTYYPEKQVRLLELWDELGIPHQKSKQVFGSALDIIGLRVDAEAMRITMSSERREELKRCTTIIPSYNQYHDFIAILRLPKRPPPSYPASRAPLSKSHQT